MQQVDMNIIAGHCLSMLGPRFLDIPYAYRVTVAQGAHPRQLYGLVSDAPTFDLPPDANLPALFVGTFATARRMIDAPSAIDHLRAPTPAGTIWVVVERNGRRFYGPLIVVPTEADLPTIFSWRPLN